MLTPTEPCLDTRCDAPVHPVREPPMTRRHWLLVSAVAAGADVFTAVEAVASTAIEHPEWDMGETRTWSEWEAEA